MTGHTMSTNEQRFRRLAQQGAIEAIRKRCEQLRTETEDGLVFHAANDIEQQGEMLYDHANALAAERDALLKQVEQLTDLLRMAGQLYNIPDHALEAMIEKALDVT